MNKLPKLMIGPPLERLVVLKGATVLGFCKNLPSTTNLPFKTVDKLPPFEQKIKISRLTNFVAKNAVL